MPMHLCEGVEGMEAATTVSFDVKVCWGIPGWILDFFEADFSRIAVATSSFPSSTRKETEQWLKYVSDFGFFFASLSSWRDISATFSVCCDVPCPGVDSGAFAICDREFE